MACDMRLSLKDIGEYVQRTYRVTAEEVVTFVRLEMSAHRDGVRFANGTEISLQRLGSGVKAHVINGLSGRSQSWKTAAYA